MAQIYEWEHYKVQGDGEAGLLPIFEPGQGHQDQARRCARLYAIDMKSQELRSASVPGLTDITLPASAQSDQEMQFPLSLDANEFLSDKNAQVFVLIKYSLESAWTATTLLEASRTVPIVFAQVIDPVGAGLVESLARPGGNGTGFIQFEYSLGGKWLELLKEVAPQVTRVGILREPGSAGIGQWAMIQAVANSLDVELKPIGLPGAGEIERAVSAFAGSPNGGLIVAVSGASLSHRELIIRLAARHQLPAVYAYRVFVTGGGLMSYGPDITGQYRRAASYSIASSRAKSRATCRCRGRPSTS
jgi:hypothetical protein